MIDVVHPDHCPSRFKLEAKHAFTWGYLDAVDADLNGVCLIWSWGLPFMPLAKQREHLAPSLNVSVYEKGELAYYALQSLSDDEVHGKVENASFDQSRINVNKQDGLSVDILLDLRIPNQQNLQGKISLRGIARHHHREVSSKESAALHGWAPQSGPAVVVANLGANDWNFSFEGRGYFDRNFGRRGLWDLNIERWIWGHYSLKNEERIFYVVEGEHPAAIGLIIAADGTTTEHQLKLSETQSSRTWTGARLSSLHFETQSGETFLETHVERVLDHAPFYARYFSTAKTKNEEVVGVTEVAWPQRLDRPWQRFFARQRVIETGSQPFMQSLFTGTQRRRWRRFLRLP